MMTLPWWLRLAGVALFVLLNSCSSAPDKRLLQYLNTHGFGNRYTGNAEEENYITIGDSMQVTDAYHPADLNLTAKVAIDGTVVLPEVGAVRVAGMTRTELQALLMEKYSPYYDLLDIQVRIRANNANKVYYVYGEVRLQGRKTFKGDQTIFDVVMDAKPIDETANMGRIRLIRADPRDPFIITIDLNEIVASGDSTFNITISERDIIYVPPTMLAQLGYFLDTLLFPVKQVLKGLTSSLNALSSYDRLENQRGGSIF